MAAEFLLLGDIEAYRDDRPIAVGYAQLRCMLAVLLVGANAPVSVDRLVDRVWGTRRLPRHPRGAVQHDITLLRRALAVADDVTIARRSTGYQLTVDTERVDVHRFHALLGHAQDTEDDNAAAALFEQALRLRRGEPFTGLDTPWLNALRTTLDAQHHAARLDLTDIHLRLGRHTDLLATLSDQVDAHPLDERLAGQYLLALYRSGRQAEAIQHHQQLRRRLADQLGLDPSPPLQQVYHQILNADSALALPTPSAVVTATSAPLAVLPRQLPAAPSGFIGRADELAQLDKTLNARTAPGGTVVISAIGGTGGIGKTWLALHWAHQHLDRFPDGQLHVDLRGYDPTGDPTPPATAVRGLLSALGVDPAEQPAEWDAQVGLYRSLVADRRMLLMLDNARDTDQVVPLLPGSPTCTVLITSRHRLAGLATAHGAHVLGLDTLSPDEAHALLTGQLGGQRVSAEPDAVVELLTWCAGLPLALRIIAARATAEAHLPLASVAEELHERTSRLDALDTGDLAANLRVTLSWSHHALSAEAAAVFELLGLAQGPDISLTAVASLTALPVERARLVLRELINGSLVRQHERNRYRMHDLVRLYAAEQARRGRPAAARTEAERRLVSFYLHTAYAGEQLLHPQMTPIPIEPAVPGSQAHPLADEAAALAWFTAEHVNLLAGHQLAAERGWHTLVWPLTYALNTFHWRQACLPEGLAVARAGLAAAEQLADPTTLGLAHQHLGLACTRIGLRDEAIDELWQAVTFAEQSGDVELQARAHHVLAGAWEEHGDPERALEHATHALRLFEKLDLPVREARARNAIGWYLALLGRYEQARVHCEAALVVFEQHSQQGEAAALDSLGYIAQKTGQYNQALDRYRRALELRRVLGNTYDQASTLEHLGETHHALGQHNQTGPAWRQALALYRAQHRTAEADRVGRQLAALDGRSESAMAR
jgi:DNA-binding SARP family transcriptional activator/Tfp pilus assembly protein PilF